DARASILIVNAIAHGSRSDSLTLLFGHGLRAATVPPVTSSSMRNVGAVAAAPLQIELPPATSSTKICQRYGRSHDQPACSACLRPQIPVAAGQATAVAQGNMGKRNSDPEARFDFSEHHARTKRPQWQIHFRLLAQSKRTFVAAVVLSMRLTSKRFSIIHRRA